MKKIIYIIFIIISLDGFTQNLVPNPDFEQYSTCPNYVDQLSLCMSWSSFRETPDYYNECAQFSTYSITPPNCFTGFQYPHSGNAFTGLFTFCSYTFAREFIGAQLLSPLVIGQKYFISLFVNLGGAIYPNHTTIASNKMGVKFSTVPYSYDNPAAINNFAHFYCNDIITDTLKWTRISGSFVADSAYSHIIIGNFFVDSLTDTVNLEAINTYANYFIDDVCVTTDSLYNENWMGIKEQNEIENKKEVITIYPNPVSNNLQLQTSLQIKNIEITDITGRQLYTTTSRTINCSNFAKGVYFIRITTEKELVIRKFIKE